MTRQLLIESLLIPGVLAAALGLLARRTGPGSIRGALVELAAVVGFVAAYVMIFGLPAWLPVSARDRLVGLGVAGAALGLLLGQLRIGREVGRAALIAWPPVVVGWLAWPAVRSLALEPSLTALTVAAIGAGFLYRWERDACRGGPRALMLSVLAAGLALVSVASAALSLAQMALALAAASAATLLAGPAVERALMTGPASLALGLAESLVLYSEASPIALLCLAPILWADRLTHSLAAGRPAWIQWLVFATGCLFPLGVAATVLRGLG